MKKSRAKGADVKPTRERATVGEAAVDLQLKAANENHTVVDQAKEQLKEYYDELINCIKENKTKITGSFYVVVITKKERLLTNVLRNYFFARISCPTPDYDQSVYFYKAEDETLSFIWTIPDRETCLLLRANASQVPAEEMELLGFVHNFANGELYKLCKKLNGEKVDSVILEK